MRRPSLALSLLLAACAPPAGDDGGDTDVATVDTRIDADTDLADTGWPFPWRPHDTGTADDADADGFVAHLDCDDHDPLVNPAADDLPSDGVDQDCDGAEPCWIDRDGDGARAELPAAARPGTCTAAPWTRADAPVDCDDASPAAHPGAAELVGTGVDEDCDGRELCFVDADLDGSRSPELGEAHFGATCRSPGLALASAPLDCDDADPTLEGGIEVVADGVDQDCDHLERCYVDADHDHARTDVLELTADVGCTAPGHAQRTALLDCDDADDRRRPGLREVIGDDVDGDCDGLESCFRDDDGDGARTTTTVSGPGLVCDAPLARATAPFDCDDADPSRHGGAIELVADGVDQDCDERELCYVDRDHDRARTDTLALSRSLTCTDPTDALPSAPLDCDDDDNAVHPGAYDDPADPIDTNCDGGFFCWVDMDLDGFRSDDGFPSDEPCRDRWDVPEATPAHDCDDSDPQVHPGAFEIPGDHVDQDCQGGDPCLLGGTSCPATSCAAIRAQGYAPSGFAWLQRSGGSTWQARCDQARDGGGWTLVASVADDGADRWGWTGGWSPSTSTFGSIGILDRDARLLGFYQLPVRDLLFVHRPSGVWAAYHDVGDGSLALDDLVYDAPAAACEPVAWPKSAGTLAVDGDLCSTDLFLGPAGWDGGVCDPGAASYGPTWSVGDGAGGCPLWHPGETGGLGPNALDPSSESDAVGFARALGLVDASGGAGAMEVWIR